MFLDQAVSQPVFWPVGSNSEQRHRIVHPRFLMWENPDDVWGSDRICTELNMPQDRYCVYSLDLSLFEHSPVIMLKQSCSAEAASSALACMPLKAGFGQPVSCISPGFSFTKMWVWCGFDMPGWGEAEALCAPRMLHQIWSRTLSLGSWLFRKLCLQFNMVKVPSLNHGCL